MNLIDATVHSINTVYAQLILDIGPTAAVNMATKMGITSPLNPYPSAVLGTNDVSPFEMASAYGTFATGGMQVTPTLVTRILGADGSVLYQPQPAPKRVLKEETAAAIDDVLQQVVLRGTGVNARIGRPVAGKTGTGEQWRDAWFVGYTPDLVTSVWIGFPDRQASMVPPATRILVQGGTWPAQIWQLYSAAALANVPVTPFPTPPPLDLGANADVPPVAVTNVIGMPVDQAEAALARDGFRATRHLVPNNDYPPGYVVNESPPPGSDAPGGSTVVIDVSTGSASSTVPDLLDLTQSDASKAVTDVGLKPRAVIQQEPKSPGSSSRKGRVWKQSPQAGSSADRNTTVTFYVNPS
jgi:penicillin-binding protein 1A